MSRRHRQRRSRARFVGCALQVVAGAALLYFARWQYAGDLPPAGVLMGAALAGGLIFAGCWQAMGIDD